MKIRIWHTSGFISCALLIAGSAIHISAGQEDTSHGSTTQSVIPASFPDSATQSAPETSHVGTTANETAYKPKDITPEITITAKLEEKLYKQVINKLQTSVNENTACLNNIASNLQTMGNKVNELTDAQSEWLNPQNIILLITCIAAIVYALITFLLHKSTKQATSFAALTQVHQQLASESSRKRRRLLHHCFENQFKDVLKRIHIVKNEKDRKLVVAGERKSSENDNNTTWVFKQEEIGVDNLMETICQKSDLTGIVDGTKVFNEALCRLDCEFAGDKQKASEVVEGVLADFDVLALPVFEKIVAAQKAAEAYAPVLERTAIKILPFVAM